MARDQQAVKAAACSEFDKLGERLRIHTLFFGRGSLPFLRRPYRVVLGKCRVADRPSGDERDQCEPQSGKPLLLHERPLVRTVRLWRDHSHNAMVDPSTYPARCLSAQAGHRFRDSSPSTLTLQCRSPYWPGQTDKEERRLHDLSSSFDWNDGAGYTSTGLFKWCENNVTKRARACTNVTLSA